MRHVLLSFALVVLFASAAPTSAAQYRWVYDDSLVDIVEDGSGSISITYVEPNDSRHLRDGIKPGTLLFWGSRDENQLITGDTYHFRSGCPATQYSVNGQFSADGSTLTLHGAAPVLRDKVSCSVLRYDDTLPEAELVFTQDPGL